MIRATIIDSSDFDIKLTGKLSLFYDYVWFTNQQKILLKEARISSFTLTTIKETFPSTLFAGKKTFELVKEFNKLYENSSSLE